MNVIGRSIYTDGEDIVRLRMAAGRQQAGVLPRHRTLLKRATTGSSPTRPPVVTLGRNVGTGLVGAEGIEPPSEPL